MREIEIKARVADKSALLALLATQNIVVKPPVTQHDRVFGRLSEDGDSFIHGSAWLRIRSEIKGDSTKQIFTMKKSVTNQMDSIEHETVIEDEAELEKIILHLGFTPYSDLTKTRQKANIGDIEVCIDTIEELGDFIEAEKLTSEDADYDAVASELWKLLESFGIHRDDHVTDGYDVLLRKQQGLVD
jgi:adenylate cyclase class 2